MEMHTSDQDLRREAIRRRLGGEQRKAICNDLGRSTSWFDKWWVASRQHPQMDFADRSRAPHLSPTQTPTAVVQAVVSIRQTLEAAATPETRYGLIRSPRATTQRSTPASTLLFLMTPRPPTSSRATFAGANRSRTFTRLTITVMPSI